MAAQMVQILLDYYTRTRSYLVLKSKNVVKFYVHIRPIFSCRVTYSYVCFISGSTYVSVATYVSYYCRQVSQLGMNWQLKKNSPSSEKLSLHGMYIRTYVCIYVYMYVRM